LLLFLPFIFFLFPFVLPFLLTSIYFPLLFWLNFPLRFLHAFCLPIPRGTEKQITEGEGRRHVGSEVESYAGKEKGSKWEVKWKVKWKGQQEGRGSNNESGS
jgi:hypothetical protein